MTGSMGQPMTGPTCQQRDTDDRSYRMEMY